MSDTLFPNPATPVSAHEALKLAAAAANLARLELQRALYCETRAWNPEAIEEVARQLNAATHLRDAIKTLFPTS